MAKQKAKPKRIIAVGSGKGGVGKSLVSTNLGACIAQGGQRVVLLDADLGSPNLHILLGLLRPNVGLSGFFARTVDTLEEAAVATMVPSLRLIPGGNPTPGLANINYGQKQRLIRQIQSLDADVVIIDVGAGTSFNVIDLFDVADVRVVTVIPQLTSLQNAYSFLKSAVFRVLQRQAQAAKKPDLIAASASKEMERIADLIEKVRESDASLADRMTAQLSHFGCVLIGNQLTGDDEMRALQAFSRMLSNFLNLEAPVAGYLSNTMRIRRSVNERRPFYLDGQADRNTLVVRQLASHVMSENVDALRVGRAAIPEATADAKSAGGLVLYGKDDGTSAPKSPPQGQNRQVNISALLNRTRGQLRVEVWAVFLDGVLIHSPVELTVGERARMIFHELSATPSISVSVRSAKDAFYALEFEEAGDLPQRILRAVSN